jgi:hypothetical protein
VQPTAFGAGMLVWTQAGNRKIMSRRTDLRYLAIAPSMKKLIPEFYVNMTEIPRQNHFAINFAQTGRKLWLNHLKCSIVFPYHNDFRNQLLRTEQFETFSPSRLNRNNSLGYFRTIIMPGIFRTHLDMGILPGAS